MVDVETLDTESTAVVLCAAITWFEFSDTQKPIFYDKLIDQSLFVKFKVREQVETLHRTKSKSTLKWWGKQNPVLLQSCFYPSPRDVTAIDGINQIKEYIKNNGGSSTSFFWARGSLDQCVLDSLCRSVEQSPIAEYYQWMDVRTAIRLCKSTSNARGYCKIPPLEGENIDFDTLEKHNPIDDIAIDVLMLTRCE